ncbi:MAG: MazG family protein [Defluviitaleaceae bacterium]|nr:MazG family protein [Defluviitaleaceae bacterium]
MEFEKFLGIMDVLLGEDGCPWDKEQTHESLRQYMLEECYEAIDAIDCGNMDALRDELGDVLLQVVFHAKLAEKAGDFTIKDVIEGISGKLVSRHTHVFGKDSAENIEDVKKIWEANKEKEREGSAVSNMKSVPKALPALVRASKVIKRSKRELPSAEEMINQIRVMFDNSINNNEEFGNILLTLAALANILDINAEFSLTNAIEAFINTER